MKLPVFQTI